MNVLNKVPVREQDAKERATNFEEVCLGYNKEEALTARTRSASRAARFPLIFPASLRR